MQRPGMQVMMQGPGMMLRVSGPGMQGQGMKDQVCLMLDSGMQGGMMRVWMQGMQVMMLGPGMKVLVMRV